MNAAPPARKPLWRRLAGAALRTGKGVASGVRLRSPHNRLVAARAARRSPLLVHVGCGSIIFKGWVNVDLAPPADLLWDLRRGLPFAAACADAVYSEHFIEHIDYEAGAKVVAEMHRILKPGGIVRMATPDLDHLVERYTDKDWRQQEWLEKPWYDFIQTRGMMLNVAMRWWGHRFLYNEEDLRRQLEAAGFQNVRRVAWGKSAMPHLANRETRDDSRLILEGTRA